MDEDRHHVLDKVNLKGIAPVRKLSALDVLVLLQHLIRANKSKLIGFEDADRTYEVMLKALGDIMIPLKTNVVESALWCCTMFRERSNFRHLNKSINYTNFVNGLCYPGETFNSYYNFFERKTDERK